MKRRIKHERIKWKKASSVLCDKRIPIRLKGKFFKSVVRPTMLYGSDCWVVNTNIEPKMKVLKMMDWDTNLTREINKKATYSRKKKFSLSIKAIKLNRRLLMSFSNGDLKTSKIVIQNVFIFFCLNFKS